jgi:hypothetical protein
LRLHRAAVETLEHRRLLADISGSYTWSDIDIGGGGFVTGVVIHPLEQDLAYVRTDVGNAYRWSESDARWTPLMTQESLPSSFAGEVGHGTGAIAVDPQDVDTVYTTFSAPDGLATVWRSTNRGDTWTAGDLRVDIEPNGTGRLDGERIAVDPQNSNNLFYGSNFDGLWQSTDGGDTWSKRTNGVGGNAGIPGNADIREVIIDADRTNQGGNGDVARYVYAIEREGDIWRSENAGFSFAKISGGSGEPETGRDWRDAEFTADRKLYVSSDSRSNHPDWRIQVDLNNDGDFGDSGETTYINAGSVWEFDANVGTWRDVTPRNAGDSYLDIAVNPFDTNDVYVVNGGNTMFRSTDGADTWDRAGLERNSADVPWHMWTNENYLSAADIAFDPHVDGRMWFAQGIGVWRSTDLSDNRIGWNGISAGIEEMVATDVIAPPGGDIVTSVWDRSGFVHEDPEVYPDQHLIRDNAEANGLGTFKGNDFSNGWDLDYSHQNPNFVVMISQDKPNVPRPPTHYSGWSDDGGRTWNVFDSIGVPKISGDASENHPNALRYGNIAVSSTNVDRMVWIPGTGAEAYYTDNRGDSWNKVSGLPGGLIGSYFHHAKLLVADPVDGSTFYAWRTSGNGDIYRSTDFGETWSKINDNPPGGFQSNFVHGRMKAMPDKQGHLWIADVDQINNRTNGGLHRSNDGGVTWDRVGPFDQALNVGFGKAAPGSNFATVFGYGFVDGKAEIHRSIDNGQTWDKIDNAPGGILDEVRAFNGDMNVFGRVYVGFAGNSFVYGDSDAPPPPAGQSPFGGSAFDVDDNALLQLENFDNGGQGVAYNDDDGNNRGNSSYRSGEGVDISNKSGATNNLAVGYNESGEWLEYTVDVQDAGTYDLVLNYASGSSNPGDVRVKLDGSTLGTFTNLTNTGGWNTFTTTTLSNKTLSAGEQVLRLEIIGGSFDLDAITFEKQGSTGGGSGDPIRINFQPGGVSTPGGYLADTGGSYGSRNGETYGWLGGSNNNTRDRNADADQKWDTLNHFALGSSRTWELALANGTYDVVIGAGDPSYSNQINSLNVEGTLFADPDGQDNRDTLVGSVSVTDGRLTISQGTGGSNAKIQWIEVTPSGSSGGSVGNVAVGGSAAASSEPVANESAAKAFDGNTSTKWLGNTTSSGAWLSYDFAGSTKHVVTSFKITSANDRPERDPRDFVLQGSNGGSWSNVGQTFTDETFSSRFQTRTFDVSNTTAYERYRLQILDNNGSTENGLGGTGLVQLAELELLAGTGGGTPGGSGAFQQNSSGLVSMQAESFANSVTRNPYSWTSKSGGNGGNHMEAGPDDTQKRFEANESSQSPRLDFEVEFNRTGTHYVWVHGRAGGSDPGESDSLHVGINGSAVSTADQMNGYGVNFNWNQNTMDGSVATVNVPSIGVHTINVWMRENGFDFDQIVLHSSSSYTPSGNVPESSKTGGGGGDPPPTGNGQTPQFWVDQIEQQPEPTGLLADLQLAAGVYVTRDTADTTAADSRYPQAAAALETWIDTGGGRQLLDKFINGQPFTAAEEPFRSVVVGVWYAIGRDVERGGHDHYLADELNLTDAELDQAEADRDLMLSEKVDESRGLASLRNGYVSGLLTSEDVQNISDYRIAKNTKSGGESFLPAHLGLHPLDLRDNVVGFAFDRVSGTEERFIGESLPDFHVREFDDVRQSSTFNEVGTPDVGFRRPLTEQGVLEYLWPMRAFDVSNNASGKPVATVKSQFEGPTSEPGIVSVQELRDGKPLILFSNAGTDIPFARGIGMIPLALDNFGDAIDWKFTATTIHDFYYAARDYNDYTKTEGPDEQHHSWDEEERARRLSQVLVQHPQIDDIDVYIDTNEQLYKDRLFAGGGQNIFYLVDENNIVQDVSGGAFQAVNNFNDTEFQLIELLDQGGTGDTTMSTLEQRRTDSADDPIVMLANATVTSIDGDDVLVDWQGRSLRLDKLAHTVYEDDRDAGSLADVVVGEKVAAFTRLSRLAPNHNFVWPEITTRSGDQLSETFSRNLGNGITIDGSFIGDGNVMEELVLVLDDLSGGNGVVPTERIRVVDFTTGDEERAAYYEADSIWRSGRVLSVNGGQRTITVRTDLFDSNDSNGRSIRDQWDAANVDYNLDPQAIRRHQIVDNWIAGSRDVTYRVPDGHSLTLNGQYVTGFGNVQVNDRVTIRMRLSDADAAEPVSTFTRVTRLPSSSSDASTGNAFEDKRVEHTGRALGVTSPIRSLFDDEGNALDV